MIYTFKSIDACQMCGSSTSQDKKLGIRLNQSQGLRPYKKKGITTSIYKCGNCGLIYSNPQPVPNDIQDHYGVPPEEYWVEAYTNDSITSLGDLPSLVRPFITFDKKPKMLDIGCGIGKAMRAWKKEGFEVFGIEPSLPFYERAIQDKTFTPENLQCVAIEDAVFPENSFDFITFGAVLEHLYEPGLALEKAMYWTKPGGIVEVAVPSANWLTAKLFNAYYKCTFKPFVTHLSPMHTPFHLFEFTKQSFEKNAVKNNYEIVNFRYGICDPMLHASVNGLAQKIMRKTNTGMEIYLLLRKK